MIYSNIIHLSTTCMEHRQGFEPKKHRRSDNINPLTCLHAMNHIHPHLPVPYPSVSLCLNPQFQTNGFLFTRDCANVFCSSRSISSDGVKPYKNGDEVCHWYTYHVRIWTSDMVWSSPACPLKQWHDFLRLYIGKESLHHSEWFQMPLSLEPACWWHLRPWSPPDIEAKTNVGLYLVAPVIKNIRGSLKGIIQLLCNYGRNPAPVDVVHLVVYLTICGLYTSRRSAWFLPSTERVSTCMTSVQVAMDDSNKDSKKSLRLYGVDTVIM